MTITKQQETEIKLAVFDWYRDQINFDFSWGVGIIEVEFPCLENPETLRRQIESILGSQLESECLSKNQDEWFLTYTPNGREVNKK